MMAVFMKINENHILNFKKLKEIGVM